MARLIDADALIFDIENNFWDYETVDGISTTLVLKQTVKDIRNCPAVDAVPVVHGRWIEAEDGDGAVCSVCGEDFCNVYLEVERFLYCPNCGAKTDLEEDNG